MPKVIESIELMIVSLLFLEEFVEFLSFSTLSRDDLLEGSILVSN
jgi:hypothetical protein